MLYVMLAGRFPFKGKDVRETLGMVAKGEYSLAGPEWAGISTDAKILISKLLKKDPKVRIKASQCLQ